MFTTEAQDQIIEEFAILDGDQEMMNFYIMELGQKMELLDEEYMIDDNLVKGCQSKVWLKSELTGDKVKYLADSNTGITKGLVSLLIRVFSGQTPEDIISAEVYFPEKIGMSRFIGTQRSNGFLAMIKQMKLEAIAYRVVLENQN